MILKIYLYLPDPSQPSPSCTGIESAWNFEIDPLRAPTAIFYSMVVVNASENASVGGFRCIVAEPGKNDILGRAAKPLENARG